jgi:tetratricopeptide (TPR) repeat protein
VSGEYNLKTGKNGDFVHAGLPVVGTYVISVSMPGAQAYYVPDIKAGREQEYKIELSPGDGKRLTKAEIKTLMAKTPGGAPTGGGKESAADKAKQTELLKKNEEIAASNKKAEESNAIVERTYKAGNEAFKAKNYDVAISQYNEGIAADPAHPGASSLLTNKSKALNARAVDTYNAAVKSADAVGKDAGIEAAKKDWREAYESSTKAVSILKAAPALTEPGEASRAKANLYFALEARADVARLFVVKVDPTQADAGVTAFEEYIAAETDPVKKLKAEHDLAQMLFDAIVFDQALVRYQKILEANPDDLNALLRSGQILFNLGAMNNGDKAKYQEAANFLAKYVEKAPDGDPFKADAKSILDTMKDTANVKPEKLPTPPRRTKRP